MSEHSTSAVRLTPVPWIVWRELTYVMHNGARVPHACVRGWSTTEALGRELLEHLEEAQPEHVYCLGTADEWADELRAVRQLLEVGVRDQAPSGRKLAPRNPSMLELRVALAEWCCPACDVPALVMCARRLELLEEPGNGGTGCARGSDSDEVGHG